MKRIAQFVAVLIMFVAAVNVVWWVAPVFGSSDVYRPLFAILVIVFASAVWRKVRDEESG